MPLIYHKLTLKNQNCALAEPGGPWQIFHTNHMLGTLDTVSEHWAPQFSLEHSLEEPWADTFL